MPRPGLAEMAGDPSYGETAGDRAGSLDAHEGSEERGRSAEGGDNCERDGFVEPEDEHGQARRAGDLGQQWRAGQVGGTCEQLDAEPAPLRRVAWVLLDPHREQRRDGGHEGGHVEQGEDVTAQLGVDRRSHQRRGDPQTLASGGVSRVGAHEVGIREQVLDQRRSGRGDHYEQGPVAEGHGVNEPELRRRTHAEEPENRAGRQTVCDDEQRSAPGHRSTRWPASGAARYGDPRARNTPPAAALLPVRSFAEIPSDRYRALSPSSPPSFDQEAPEAVVP